MKYFYLDNDCIPKLKRGFKKIVQQLKANIRYLGKGKENVFEQLFVENNSNKKNSPEFIILDRQIVIPGCGKERLDLVAISKLKDSQEYRLNLVELKYGRDGRIPDTPKKQIKKYHNVFLKEYDKIIENYETIIKQKKSIGRWPYRKGEFRLSRNPSTMRNIIVLGNIRDNSSLIETMRKKLDNNTFYCVQNNILRENKLLDKNNKRAS